MTVEDVPTSAGQGRAASHEARILFVEDVPAEVEVAEHRLKTGGLACVTLRVDTEVGLRDALRNFRPSVILSDFSLPGFDGLAALEISREIAPEVPFIFLSGTIGEERAVEALKSGAVDYVIKTNTSRLVPAITRALDEAAARAQKRQHEAQIARLTRVLRMQSGITNMVLRIRDRQELLDEACRHAVTTGGYASATVLLRHPAGTLEPVAWTGTTDPAHPSVRGPIDRVLASGTTIVSPEKATVILPLVVDKTPVGVMVLQAPQAGALGDEELNMLHEAAANLGFGLQYLQKDSAVHFLSYFDPHTGLAKRALFCERLQRTLERGGARPAQPAVAVVDVEKLSAINDAFGRYVGDLLLQHVADRLRRHFRDSEMLAQMGGGTFAIGLDMAGRSQEMMAAVDAHLEAIFGEPFDLEGRLVPVVVKAGVARHPDDGADAHTLLQNAEAALRSARASGQRNAQFAPEQHSSVVARLTLEHKMRTALLQQQFELYYQPKVELGTQRIVGAEALIRWRDPATGPVSPAEFLPVLESTGMIADVGHWVVEQASRDCREWRRLGLPPLRIAVNISPVQLRRPDFARRFLLLTEEWASRECGLDIEITEGALTEDASAEVQKLHELSTAGVRLAIDDFGTAYSSLSRLAELPIDTIKIDRSFVSRLPDDGAGRTLVSIVISLAHALGMDVVAEGVETQAQLQALRELGCDQAQGYYFSKPVPADAFVKLLQRPDQKLPA